MLWLRLALAKLLMSDPWGPDARCWGWEFDADTILEQSWTEGLGDACMHQGAVPVTLHMCFKALVRTVPSYLAEIVAVARPVAETFEVLDDTHSNLIRLQIQKCVTQAKFGLEIRRYMDEVVRSREALII